MLTDGAMLRAALGIAFLSAVTNLIGIVNLSSCASLPPEIYCMPCAFIFHLLFDLSFASRLLVFPS